VSADPDLRRKHIKVEPDLFYYAADTLGIIVMQDMVALNTETPNDEDQAEWERQLDIMVRSHLSFPSILTFMVYNGKGFAFSFSRLCLMKVYQRVGVSNHLGLRSV
jgi:beta-galactosidase/beta-glucuronidase